MRKPLTVVWRQATIRTRASVAAASLSLLGIACLTAIVLHSVREGFRAVLLGQQTVLVRRAAQDLDAKIAQDIDLLRRAAGKLSQTRSRNPVELRALYEGDVGLRAHFDDLLVIDAEGRVIADLPAIEGRIGIDVSDRAYFRNIMRTREAEVSEPLLGRVRKGPIVNIAAPAFDDDGNIRALVLGVLRLDSSNVLGDLAQTRIGQTGYFVLFGRGSDPVYIAHPDRARILQPRVQFGRSSTTSRAIAGDTTGAEDRSVSGMVALRTYQRLQTTGWLLEAVFPSAEAFAPIVSAQRDIVVIAAAFSLLVAGLAWLGTRRFLAPLTALRDHMQRMLDGTAGAQEAPPEGSDEIGRLAATFQALMRERRRAAEAAQEDGRRLRLASKVFETTGDAVIVSDAADTILMVNPAFTRMTGYAPEAMVGRKLADSPFRPLDPEASAVRMEQQLREGYMTAEVLRHHRDGSKLPLWVTASNVTDDSGLVTHFVRVFTDISRLKQAQRDLEQLARRDPLTTLLNRRGFDERLSAAIEQAKGEGTGVAVLMVDLDGFKAVNDSFGHAAGDDLLREVADRLRGSIRAGDALCRIGGDEFAAILSGTHTDLDAADAARRILRALGTPFPLQGRLLSVHASIGHAHWPDDGVDAEAVVHAADTTMYEAKRAGGRRALRHGETRLSLASG